MTVALTFRAVDLPADQGMVEGFLSGSVWPFHMRPVVAVADVADVELVSPATASFWALLDGEPAALIRLQDLDDIGELGAPLFDLRVAEAHRGRGVGRQCVSWLTGHLFDTYPALRRVEGQTRSDNLAMQAVFDHCGYTREARYREAWPTADGEWLDTIAYGILRREWLQRG